MDLNMLVFIFKIFRGNLVENRLFDICSLLLTRFGFLCIVASNKNLRITRLCSKTSKFVYLMLTETLCDISECSH